MKNELSEAVKNGGIENVQKFIDEGADVNATDEHGISPLYWAVSLEHKDIAGLLINRGANLYTGCNNGSDVIINHFVEKWIYESSFINYLDFQ